MPINRSPNQQDLSWFIDMENQERLDLEPPYQRRSVWTPKDRYFFLDTIFNNYPSPAIYLQKENTTKGPKYNVVDGKQRLQTVLRYYHNKYAIPQNFPIVELRGKKFKDISAEYSSKFYNYVFSVEQLFSMHAEEDWNEVFFRVNRSQKQLTPQELRHARYDGWFINRAESEVKDLTANPGLFWKNIKVSSTQKNRRMKDVEFISTLMLLILEKRFVGFPQSDIDILYGKYNFELSELPDNDADLALVLDPDDDEPYIFLTKEDIKIFEDRFSFLKDFIFNMEEANHCITNHAKRLTTDLYSLWALLALSEIVDTLTPEKMAEIFDSFLSQIDEVFIKVKQGGDISTYPAVVMTYTYSSMGAATEEDHRKKRHESFSTFIKNYES
ncbi:MAG: DUF262 domain-containing protein [Proteobacteria bacterium]|nr:DUF262 domain-containing protein [Pseudomonadota bacterium]MBU1648011.1 DUF262 domain-containing protein [Pseudomonadota bacterium]